ncbi:T9SS type A sorting domain-containing protein [Paracrocinitomix mangrovi]|uniref:T9SS type A sorting domain-containing protein n=1 Tax=Paracrocinitomix mangrovi TaxID=2862509 RepID=UPI001C8EC0B2|nr:T9SS type A sorting domain-containing protein [Paracrocinitomix mangrovi]UKN03220.1 T9SS type A sorting domain-containing protein [Paracrocinitomix mangrovi]
MRIVVFISFLLLTGISYSQSLKSTFKINQLNGEVHLSLTIHSGNTCNGLTIYRSKDSLNFESIGVIDGYCGSLTESITYNFTDENPIVNQVSYYRFELMGLESSEIKSIKVIDLEGKNFKIWPNPISDTATIYFNNDLQKEIAFNVYDLSGKLVYSLNTSSSEIPIDTSEFVNGTFIFVIRDEDKEVAKGKFIVQK